MINKPVSSDRPSSMPASQPGSQSAPAPADEGPRQASRTQKGGSTIAADTVLEGNISGGNELLIDGTIKGDVRMENVTVGSGGGVEGGIYAESVEVRGRITGSITAKRVRLFDDCHVEGDITHGRMAMEEGAFFQGRSLRMQPPAPAEEAVKPEPPATSAKPEPPAAPAKPEPADLTSSAFARPKPAS
jgi:cytoskeletal protein CcmA (bactofilin family)